MKKSNLGYQTINNGNRWWFTNRFFIILFILFCLFINDINVIAQQQQQQKQQQTLVSWRDNGSRAVNVKCRELFGCTIRKNCIQLSAVEKLFTNSTIGARLYNELDKHIDYGCVFTSGCLDECDRCPLCAASKQQLVDVLSGKRRDNDGECSVLVNCATECLENSGNDFTKINYCLRHKCAFHCFDSSCPKCSAFITRIFNQICVSGNLRSKINNWKGHCYEMFRAIVFSKFQNEFELIGRQPSIGNNNKG